MLNLYILKKKHIKRPPRKFEILRKSGTFRPRSCHFALWLYNMCIVDYIDAWVDEKKLFSKLFSDYNTDVRPRLNSTEPVVVTLQLELRQIKNLVGDLILYICFWYTFRRLWLVLSPTSTRSYLAGSHHQHRGPWTHWFLVYLLSARPYLSEDCQC